MKTFYVTVLAMVLGASVCAAQVDKANPPELQFAETIVYNVDATSKVIDIRDATPKTYPQVGHLSLITFEAALRNWADKRFQVTGNSVNTLRITMSEGRITEILLPITKGIGGWFKKEEATKYEAALKLEIAIVDPNGQIVSKAEASAMASQSLLEGASRDKKERAMVELVNICLNNVDRELRTQLPQYMGQYIK